MLQTEWRRRDSATRQAKMLTMQKIEDLEAAGVERERGAIVNLLMVRDFWANAFRR